MNKLPTYITNELIAAYLNGEASSQQISLIMQWLESSAENKLIFESYEKTWKESLNLDPVPVFVDTNKAWNKLSSRINSANEKNKVRSFTQPITKQWRWAAIILIPLALGFILYAKIKFSTNELVATNQILHNTLPDSSKITLNAKSKITYNKAFKGSIREVTLEGEAFFEVVKDTNSPFIIHTSEAQIKVLGTSFSVNAYAEGEEVEVIVKTGKVLLYSEKNGNIDSSSVLLMAGDKGYFNKRSGKAWKNNEFNNDELFWANKTLMFSKTELSAVINILHRCYNINITLKNKNLENCRLSATFTNQNIDTILEIIASSFNLKIIKNGTKYEFDGDGC